MKLITVLIVGLGGLIGSDISTYKNIEYGEYVDFTIIMGKTPSSLSVANVLNHQSYGFKYRGHLSNTLKRFQAIECLQYKICCCSSLRLAWGCKCSENL